MADGGNLPIGPGIWGFIAFFVLAVALWFLVRNMNSRLRRMAYRDRERAEVEDNALTDADAPADAEGLRTRRADAASGSGDPFAGDGPDETDASGGAGTDPGRPRR
jgi:hypothetical protein